MNTAFLLAAGYGTRLRPLTWVIPKALVPLCGVPMLDYALAQARAHGHREVLVNAHWLWEQVAAWCERSGDAEAGLRVELQVELPEILGTGGGLRAAEARLAERFVVLNADILSDVDLGALRDLVPEAGAAMALRSLDPAEAAEPTAPTPVLAGPDGVVREIRGIVETPGGTGTTHFTGVHAMHRTALSRVPPEGLQCVVRTAYRGLVAEGRVRSLVHGGTWVDVGDPAAYLAANLALLDGDIETVLDPWSRGARGPGGSWVGAGARLEGRVSRSVVGAGANVPPGAELVDCVVWDGVSVPPGVHRGAIFYAAPGTEAPDGSVLDGRLVPGSTPS